MFVRFQGGNGTAGIDEILKLTYFLITIEKTKINK